jgi:hypothetical protein
MQKHLANLTILQPTTDGPVGSWHLALNHWKEARQLRKIEVHVPKSYRSSRPGFLMT